MDAGDWVAGAIAAAAVVVSVIALGSARRSARAAEEAAAAAVTSAAVAEREEARQVELEASTAVSWEVRRSRHKDGEVLVRNVGTQVAFNVAPSLSPTTAVGNVVLLPTQPEVLPTDAVRVDRTGHHEPGQWVGISWTLSSDPAAERREVRLLLPSVPPPRRVY